MSGWPKTLLTALDRALAPSSTARTGLVTSRPRSRSPVIRSVTRVAFSVEPSSTASGYFVPSMPMPSATTQVCSPKCTPSTMNATRSSPSSRLLISSAKAVSVAATNRRDTADLLTDAAASPTARPAGSRPRTYRRDDSPASIFSSASWPRISVLLNRS